MRHVQTFNKLLNRKVVFFTISLMRANHQIPMALGVIPKTTICTPFGLFKFPFMAFGPRNTAQTFQGFINKVLCDLDFSHASIDDILITPGTKKQNFKHLWTFSKLLQKYDVLINFLKCHFKEAKAQFRRCIVSKEGMQILLEKANAIQKLTRPKTAKD